MRFVSALILVVLFVALVTTPNACRERNTNAVLEALRDEISRGDRV